MEAAVSATPTLRRTIAAIWDVTRARWDVLLLAALIVFIPVGLLEAVDDELQRPLEDPDDVSALEVVEIVISAIVHTAGSLGGEVIYAGIAAGVIAGLRDGRPRSLGRVLRELPILRLAVIDLLLALVVGVGLLLLLIPGIVLLVWFALAPAALKLEHLTIRAAFARSRELVRGRFWLVFWLVVPLAVLGDAATELATSGSIWAFGETFAGNWIAAVLVNLVTAPPFALAAVVLFYELRDSGAAPARA